MLVLTHQRQIKKSVSRVISVWTAINLAAINDYFCSVFQKTNNCNNNIRFYNDSKFNNLHSMSAEK